MKPRRAAWRGGVSLSDRGEPQTFEIDVCANAIVVVVDIA